MRVVFPPKMILWIDLEMYKCKAFHSILIIVKGCVFLFMFCYL